MIARCVIGSADVAEGERQFVCQSRRALTSPSVLRVLLSYLYEGPQASACSVSAGSNPMNSDPDGSATALRARATSAAGM